MEEHVLSITRFVNHLLGPLALSLLHALHVAPSDPELPIPEHVVMGMLVVLVGTLLALLVKSKLSVAKPGGAQQHDGSLAGSHCPSLGEYIRQRHDLRIVSCNFCRSSCMGLGKIADMGLHPRNLASNDSGGLYWAAYIRVANSDLCVYGAACGVHRDGNRRRALIKFCTAASA